jgi:hypothetical protein
MIATLRPARIRVVMRSFVAESRRPETSANSCHGMELGLRDESVCN